MIGDLDQVTAQEAQALMRALQKWFPGCDLSRIIRSMPGTTTADCAAAHEARVRQQALDIRRELAAAPPRRRSFLERLDDIYRLNRGD